MEKNLWDASFELKYLVPGRQVVVADVEVVSVVDEGAEEVMTVVVAAAVMEEVAEEEVEDTVMAEEEEGEVDLVEGVGMIGKSKNLSILKIFFKSKSLDLFDFLSVDVLFLHPTQPKSNTYPPPTTYYNHNPTRNPAKFAILKPYSIVVMTKTCFNYWSMVFKVQQPTAKFNL
jgi:hypothetical protein